MAALNKVWFYMAYSMRALGATKFATHITVDANAIGARFDGVGGASGGGGGTRLLVDYDKDVRSDILDYLFTPMFGASMQHIKVEIGCDGDTTQGSEPTHARSATDVDYDRGYEVWFMEEALKRRPDIQTSGLEWGIPGWVASSPGGMWGKTNVDYLVGWAKGLRNHKNISLTSLAVAYNEKEYNANFIKAVRRALNEAGMSTVKTIAPDSWSRMWSIARDMEQDPALNVSIDIIGTHCPGAVNGHPSNQPPLGIMHSLRKPLWSTEQHIGENGLGGNNTQNESAPVTDYRAALGLAKVLNQGYITANQTSTLIWTPTWSWYDYLLYQGKGLVVANTPWSGHYQIPDAVWAVAHTTQFAQPGWWILGNSASSLLADGVGSVVSYMSNDRQDLSIVLETAQSNVTNIVHLKLLGGAFKRIRSLHAWRTVLPDGPVFISETAVQVVEGVCIVVLEPGTLLSLTTTSGQRKGVATRPVPPSKPFPLPYSDDFEGYPRVDSTPRFTSDMHGVFTTAAVPGVGMVLRQQTSAQPTCTHCSRTQTAFSTIIGGSTLVDYQVEVTVRFSADQQSTNPSDFLFLASHIGVADGAKGSEGLPTDIVTSNIAPAGFVLKIKYEPASWSLQAGVAPCSPHFTSGCRVKTVAFGRGNWQRTTWLKLSLSAIRGSNNQTTLAAAINDLVVVKSMQVLTLHEVRGAAALGSSIVSHSEWDNLTFARPASVLI